MQIQANISKRIDQAAGRSKADLVIKNARLLNTATGSIEESMDIAICGDRIVGTHDRYDGEVEFDAKGQIACPGFIDSHLHIESSMVLPSEFEKGVLPCGTTTAICDPHEIANVVGLDGIRYFLDAAKSLALSLRVNLSSCVPATDLETAGAHLEAEDLIGLKGDPAVIGLAEMMNYPGVIFKDPGILAKLAAFDGCHIDGHAPLVRGRDLNSYLSANIRTDHECSSLEEAQEKLAKGMHVLIREGSIAKNVENLAPLVTEATWPRIGFCTDDRNPLEIRHEGHINFTLRKAIRHGAEMIPAYRAATLGAAMAFGLRDRGVIGPGYRADIVLIDDLDEVDVSTVWVGGKIVNAELFEGRIHPKPVGHGSIKRTLVNPQELEDETVGERPVIGIIPFQIITEHLTMAVGENTEISRLCVLERHGVNGNIGKGHVHGFGPLDGAIATSIGHDSHNITVVGNTASNMAAAVNHLIDIQGGAVVVRDQQVIADLPLPVAGLMSDQSFDFVDEKLVPLRQATRAIGCAIEEPLLQLAFLPLPVIPHLKLTDRGYVATKDGQLVLL